MTIKKFKPFIGSKIYRIPTGNSVRSKKPLNEQIEEVTLLKVGNKLLTTSNGSYEESYDWQGHYNQHNYGYMYFTTKKETENYFIKNDLEQKFRKAFQYSTTNYSVDALELAWSVLNDKYTT